MQLLSHFAAEEGLAIKISSGASLTPHIIIAFPNYALKNRPDNKRITDVLKSLQMVMEKEGISTDVEKWSGPEGDFIIRGHALHQESPSPTSERMFDIANREADHLCASVASTVSDILSLHRQRMQRTVSPSEEREAEFLFGQELGIPVVVRAFKDKPGLQIQFPNGLDSERKFKQAKRILHILQLGLETHGVDVAPFRLEKDKSQYDIVATREDMDSWYMLEVAQQTFSELSNRFESSVNDVLAQFEAHVDQRTTANAPKESSENPLAGFSRSEIIAEAPERKIPALEEKLKAAIDKDLRKFKRNTGDQLDDGQRASVDHMVHIGVMIANEIKAEYTIDPNASKDSPARRTLYLNLREHLEHDLPGRESMTQYLADTLATTIFNVLVQDKGKSR
jgi:hypothetical protein